MMPPKRRLLFAVSGSLLGTLCGLCVFLLGLDFHFAGIIQNIGILMIIGGVIATVFLLFTLPRR